MNKIMKFKKLLIAVLVIGMSVAAVMPQLLAVSGPPGTWDRGLIPEIEKTVNGGTHLDLVNRDDVFTWEVKTSFEYGGELYTQLIITDEVNPLLDILSVSVVDAYGNNTQAWGVLEVNDVTNVITFEFTTNPLWDSLGYLNGQVFTMLIETKIKDSATDEDLAPYMEANGITNTASVNLSDGTSILSNEVTVMTPGPDNVPDLVIPVNPEIVSTVNGGTHLDLVNRDDVFTLETSTSFGNQGENWTELIITDEVNPLLDILNVSVVNALGENVEAYGNLYVDPVTNVITFELYSVDGNFKHVNEEVFTIVVETKIKDSATDEDLAPYMEANGILHNAKLNFGDGSDSIVSETVSIMPPTPDNAPIDPEIISTVNGGTHLDLMSRDEVFTFEDTTVFGNQGANWTQLIITDEINPLLDIVSVNVIDELGYHVTNYGDLIVDDVNNVITFELNAVNGNFEHLNGELFTLVIETRIKDTTTDVDLAPYMEANGIPNAAILSFADGSNNLVSDGVTVMPPIEGQGVPIDTNNPITPDDSKLPHTGIANSVVGALALLMVAGLVTILATRKRVAQQ